jgi:hypothetical protein
MKRLRDEGWCVVVEPDDGTKLSYLAEKGLREFLSDPIRAFVVGIPLSVLLNVVSSWLYDRFKRPPRDDEVHMVLEFDLKGGRVRYDHKGRPIDESRFQSILESLNERASAYKASLNVAAPDPVRPVPIYLEHLGRIVGWARVFPDSKGLRVEDGRITDLETWTLIQSGKLGGMSIGGLISDATCSVCGGEYIDCNHIAGVEYSGVECVVRIDTFHTAEISIVRDPVNPLARIELQM